LNLAIELVLMLRLVFHLALRQAEGSLAACSGCSGLISPFPTTPPSADEAVPSPVGDRALLRTGRCTC
jgi:hypothetical protein